MVGSLVGSQAKVERAKQHIQDLQRRLTAFYKTSPYVVGTKRDPETRRLIYYLVSVQDPPVELSVIAGDVLQNLRSALDHLAYQLVLVGTNGIGAPFRHVYYPIFNSKAEYEPGKLGQIKGMRQDAIDAVDATKPYKGGNDILWRIHQLNRVDKHRLLITVGSAYKSFNVWGTVRRQFEESFGTTWTKEILGGIRFDMFLKPQDRRFPLKAGDELFADLPDAEPDEDIDFRVEVALGESKVIEGQPLIETLQEMIDLVDNLLPSFEPLVQ